MITLYDRKSFDRRSATVMAQWAAVVDQLNFERDFPGVTNAAHRSDVAHTCAAFSPATPWKCADLIEGGDVQSAIRIAQSAVAALYDAAPDLFVETPDVPTLTALMNEANGNQEHHKYESERQAGSPRGRHLAVRLRRQIAERQTEHGVSEDTSSLEVEGTE